MFFLKIWSTTEYQQTKLQPKVSFTSGCFFWNDLETILLSKKKIGCESSWKHLLMVDRISTKDQSCFHPLNIVCLLLLYLCFLLFSSFDNLFPSLVPLSPGGERVPADELPLCQNSNLHFLVNTVAWRQHEEWGNNVCLTMVFISCSHHTDKPAH